MKFLLLRPGSDRKTFFFTPFSYFPPLGLLYLGAALEKQGHKVEVIDFFMEINVEERIKNSLISSDAVGISLYTNNCKSISEITKIIRDIDPNIPIIIGGPSNIYLQEKSLSYIPDANISVIGEGEQVIIDIAQFLEGKKNLSEISGIYYRENNIIKKGKDVEIIKNLDSLDYPARHLTDKYEYGKINNEYLFKPRFTAMETSRGCPHNCRFCARPNNSIPGYGFRQRSAQNVANELMEINKRYGSVSIVDDNFLANKKRAMDILQKLIDYGTDIDLMILSTRVDSADKELYKKMKEANVKFIGFGLESGNQDVLDYYNKNFTLDQARRAVRLSRKMGFISIGSFIVGAPIETKEHLENTIKFAYSLPLDIALFNCFTYIKGSQLWIEAVKDNKIKEDEHFVVTDSGRNLGNFTEDTLSKKLRKVEKNFYLRPGYIFNQLFLSIYRRNLFLLKHGFHLITSL